MKKLILSLTAVLLSLTLAACAAEEIPSLKGGHQDNAASPLDGEVNTVEAEITVSDPEAPQSDGEWGEWVCIAERPDDVPTITLTEYANGTAEFAIQNNTEYEWGYGLEPYFHKYNEEKGVWLSVDPITDIAVPEIYCILQLGGSSTYTLPIEQYYGDIPDGLYRAGLIMRKQTEECEAEWILCDFHFIDGEIARDISCY